MLKRGVLTLGLVFFLLCCSAPLMLSVLICLCILGGRDEVGWRRQCIENGQKPQKGTWTYSHIHIRNTKLSFNSINTFQYHHLTCKFSSAIYFRPSSLQPNLFFSGFLGSSSPFYVSFTPPEQSHSFKSTQFPIFLLGSSQASYT